jgi:hypothetical protein
MRAIDTASTIDAALIRFEEFAGSTSVRIPPTDR